MTAIQVPLTMAELDALTPEHVFGSQLWQWAEAHGWKGYHQRPARTRDGWRTPLEGDRGFPDWVFVHRERDEVVVAELKSKTGRVDPQQAEWLAAWGRIAAASNGAIRVFVWRPADRDAAYAVLAGGEG